MKKIYLVRHGQDQDNSNGILNGQRDTELTEIGFEQAGKLTETIKESNLEVTKIYSSPLKRAFRTAEIVAKALDLEVPEKLDLLIERNFGVMTGQLVKDITEKCAPNILQSDPITYFLEVEGAETFPELIARGKKLLEWLEQNNQAENIMLISHGDIGKMIYAAFYNLDWKDVLLQFHFGNSEVLLLAENTKLEDRYVHKTEQHNH